MRFVSALLLAAVLVSGCAHKRRSRISPSPAPQQAAPQAGDTETGLASWYGHPYHGRAAADGEIYDMEKLTAAHRTLPFNTWVRVRDLDNQKTVDVRIIDRGPFVDGRIIDLSHAAARAIDMIGPGVARVQLEVLQAPVTAAGAFGVQVGAFRSQASAEQVCRDMETRYGSARLVLRQGTPPLWRVLVGTEATEDAASLLAGRIRKENEKTPALVVRLDSF